MDKKYIAGGIIALLIVAGVSFYGGTVYAHNARPTFRQGFTNGQFGEAGNQAFRGRAGGGVTAGQVIAKDATSVTVKMQDGSTKIVLLSDSTQVMKTASGSLSDLSVGTNVLVTGSANQDGSVTAQTVSIRPTLPQQPTSAPQGQ